MRQLPLIDFALDITDENFLEGCYVIGVQHILDTSQEMFHALFEKGLKPENLSLLGKCYSTNPAILQNMKKMGVDICDRSSHFDSYQSFDETFSENVRAFIEKNLHKITSGNFRKILVLDDGGHLLNELEKYITDFDGICALEQTSSGYNRLKHKNFSFPIVNLAKAASKSSLETPYITDAIIGTLYEKLRQMLYIPKRILVIGQGTIGKAISAHLKNDLYHVDCFDERPEKSDFRSEELNQRLKEYDLIIGCTGNTSIQAAQHRYLKRGTILASASSSDREFDVVHLRREAKRTFSCSDDIISNGIKILNCGFPLNFGAGPEKEPAEVIQFTRALLMLSMFQATQDSSSKGFINLDLELQNALYIEFRSLLDGAAIPFPKVKLTPSIIRTAQARKSAQTKRLDQKRGKASWQI